MRKLMTLPRDIEAEIYFLTPNEGGRSTPVFSGYRGQFYYDGLDFDARQEYPDVETVKPGETVRTYLAFMSPKLHHKKLYEGMEFLVREGAKTVGKGTVTKVIDLEKSAKN
ncbi:hypothetical protein [Glaciecola sp. MF2-115]|uniref:EF-Tu C-terminal domain-related protein n=1 Tax=Glaciecola sp. MF2-115 TaxID=3384827 RepID=UPI0039A218CA